MRPGDRVLVTVLGERVPGTVSDPNTALANVLVRLDAEISIEGLGVTQVVRSAADVEPLRPDPTRVVREWEPPDDPVPVVADAAYRDALRGGPARQFSCDYCPRQFRTRVGRWLHVQSAVGQ